MPSHSSSPPYLGSTPAGLPRWISLSLIRGEPRQQSPARLNGLMWFGLSVEVSLRVLLLGYKPREQTVSGVWLRRWRRTSVWRRGKVASSIPVSLSGTPHPHRSPSELAVSSSGG